MLTKCPVCNLQISDKAITCPHCGYPLKEIISQTPKRSKKHKRLPNGFGQISEIKNRGLRKPFRAMVTIGVSETGHPISKMLQPNAYFKTYNEAYEALMQHNKTPYSIDQNITVKELYDRWFADYTKDRHNKETYRHFDTYMKHFSKYYDVKVVDIRPGMLKDMIENINTTTSKMKSAIKSVLNMMYDYAVEYDIVEKNIARSFTLSRGIIQEARYVQHPHKTFTDDEIMKLWANIHVNYIVRAILIQCYMGWRPSELCNIKMSDVDLTNWTITGGMKTAAGKNRCVPIMSKIRSIVQEQYNFALSNNSEYLFISTEFNNKSQIVKLDYYSYNKKFTKVLKSIGMDSTHTAHDCRVRFVSNCKNHGVNEYAIKYLVGHSITDITEGVYTRRDPKFLQQEIEKIF